MTPSLQLGQLTQTVQTVNFLLKPNFHQLTIHSILLAIGQTFFSLGIAAGVIMMFGAYLDNEASIPKTSIIICLIDTAVALLAGLAIFPIVFANHISVTSGPGLIFNVLPIDFGNMPWGNFFGLLFFMMLALAAFTSTVALMEPIVATISRKLKIKRPLATWLCATLLFVVGLGTILSFNIGSAFFT